TVNRTGAPQQEQLIQIAGAQILDELLLGQPFAQGQQLPTAPIITAIRFFGAPNNVVPATDALDPPVTSGCPAGFSVADHTSLLLGWSWASFGGLPTVPIADPGFSFQMLDSKTLRFSLLNESGDNVEFLNARLTTALIPPTLPTLGTDAPHP